MKKNIILLIFIAITTIIIITATVYNQKEQQASKPTIEEVLESYDNEMLETVKNSNMDQVQIDKVVDSFLAEIEKSEDKKSDRDLYVNKVKPVFEELFEDLNSSTYMLVDDMIEAKVKNIDDSLKFIADKELKINSLIEEAIKNSKTEEFKIFYESVIKYNKIQNAIINETAEYYKKHNKVTENILNEIFMEHMNTVNIDDYISLEILAKIK